MCKFADDHRRRSLSAKGSFQLRWSVVPRWLIVDIPGSTGLSTRHLCANVAGLANVGMSFI